MSRGARGRGVKRDFPGGDLDGAQTIKVARRIFVNNLPFNCTWQELKDHFKSAGKVVHATTIGKKEPRGCGVVEFSTAEEAARAINTLHQSELGGRVIYIREDREDKDLQEELGRLDNGSDFKKRPRNNGRSSGGSTRGSGRGAPVQGSVEIGKRVYVNNLSYNTTWQTLKDFFKQAGQVHHASIISTEKGVSKGCGVVEFLRADDALRAISQLSNLELDGRVITVREDREDKTFPRTGGAARPSPSVRSNVSSWQIVVQGLPYSTTWQELKTLIGNNAVHADIVMSQNGQSRGYGTVRFSSQEDAQKAITDFDQQTYKDRLLTVKWDKFA